MTTADGGVPEKDDRLPVEALDARIDAEAPYHPRGCVAQAWSGGGHSLPRLLMFGSSRQNAAPDPFTGVSMSTENTRAASATI